MPCVLLISYKGLSAQGQEPHSTNTTMNPCLHALRAVVQVIPFNDCTVRMRCRHVRSTSAEVIVLWTPTERGSWFAAILNPYSM